MGLADDLKERLRQEEGCRLFSYHDQLNHLTIAYGYLLEGLAIERMQKLLGFNDLQRERVVAGAYPITTDQAEKLLDYTARCAVTDAADVVGKEAWPRLAPVAQLVCADMTFQLGEVGFAGFHKMLAALRLDPPDYGEASHQMANSKAAQQTPVRYRGLCRLMSSCAEPAPPTAA